MYADDSQVYVSAPANDATAVVTHLSACIADINDWMKASQLRLNPSKTQVMWLGTSQQLAKITVSDVPLLSAVVTVADSARNLGVIIDSQLCLDAQVTAVCHCGYYQLRQLRLVIRSLSAKATETLVQAFVSSRLDYCNSLLYTVAFSLSRMPPHDLCPGYDDAITSRRPYTILTVARVANFFIGYPCDSEYCSKSLSLFTNV